MNTIVSAFINILFSLKTAQAENTLLAAQIPLGAVAVIFIFMRFPLIRAWGDRMLECFANRLLKNDASNSVILLDYIGRGTIALVTLNSIPTGKQNIPLSEMGLRAETGISVMLIERKWKEAEPAGPDTVFLEGDKLTVFGDYTTICKVFQAKERFSVD